MNQHQLFQGCSSHEEWIAFWVYAIVRDAKATCVLLILLTPDCGIESLIRVSVEQGQDHHAAIQHVRHVAEQLPKTDRWATLLTYICQRIVGQIRLPTPPQALSAVG